jgi:hypothetical protein
MSEPVDEPPIEIVDGDCWMIFCKQSHRDRMVLELVLADVDYRYISKGRMLALGAWENLMEVSKSYPLESIEACLSKALARS